MTRVLLLGYDPETVDFPSALRPIETIVELAELVGKVEKLPARSLFVHSHLD